MVATEELTAVVERMAAVMMVEVTGVKLVVVAKVVVEVLYSNKVLCDVYYHTQSFEHKKRLLLLD